jgi:hypothetical protein
MTALCVMHGGATTMERAHCEWMSTAVTHPSARLLTLSLAVAAMTLVVFLGPAQALAADWFDDFSGGNGNPLWVPHPALEGNYSIESRGYIFTPGSAASNDESMIAAVQEASFTDVSVRTRTRSNLNGSVGVIGRMDFATVRGYIALVDYAGLLILSRFEGGQVSDEFNLNLEIPELAAVEDLIVQLDIFGDTLSLTAWRPGDPQPAPQIEGTDPAFASGTAGLAFNEDEEGSAGIFRWAAANSVRIINGDTNFDGEVNGLDVELFVATSMWSSPIPFDMNGDAVFNGLDVDPFVAAVVGGGTQPAGGIASVPEPSTILLALLGGACCAIRRRARP